MRQAGRYLPEYRALRERTGSFWKLCMEPKLAAEVTLQPVHRFDFDAAIIFSDILVVPRALGVEVDIDEGFGPRMKAIASVEDLSADANRWREITSPVYEAISLVRGRLQQEKALIGFAGGPWTLATYLAQGHGSADQRAAKLWAYRDPEGFDRLLGRLADSVTSHLAGQIRAGADVVQIFDSWSSGLSEKSFERWVIAPTKRIVAGLRELCPGARIIGFPRATTQLGYESYAVQTGVDAVSLDTAVPMRWATQSLSRKVVLQGNLDPIVLIAGGRALVDAIGEIVSATRTSPFIFNLGHGILPETPVENVEKLVTQIRAIH